MSYSFKTINSPVGELKLVANDKGIVAVLWENDPPLRVPLGEMEEDNRHPLLMLLEKQLKEYFSGKRRDFDVPLAPLGTDFQKKVWKQLSRIPYGTTDSYKGLAEKIGSPKACRAVGAANGRNPISIVVPCHRVVGSDGSMTGFAGGIPLKKQLLELERKNSK